MADAKRKSFSNAFSSLLKQANAPESKQAKKQPKTQKRPLPADSTASTQSTSSSGKKRRRAPPPENPFSKFRQKSQRPPKKQKKKRQNATKEKTKGNKKTQQSNSNSSEQQPAAAPPATKQEKPRPLSAKQRKKLAKAARDGAHVQPDVAVDAKFERMLKKIATRGVIKLFNAVQKQQDALAREEREVDFKPARKQRADSEAAHSSFMAMLRSNPKSAKSESTTSSTNSVKKESSRSISHRSSTGLGQDEFGLSDVGRTTIKEETRRSSSPDTYVKSEAEEEDDDQPTSASVSASKWEVLDDHFLTGSGDDGGDAASDGDFEDDMSD